MKMQPVIFGLPGSRIAGEEQEGRVSSMEIPPTLCFPSGGEREEHCRWGKS